ncbi:hypothetical protein GYB59_15455 [bacterium]|nr:hypothetical protein [bacterium]
MDLPILHSEFMDRALPDIRRNSRVIGFQTSAVRKTVLHTFLRITHEVAAGQSYFAEKTSHSLPFFRIPPKNHSGMGPGVWIKYRCARWFAPASIFRPTVSQPSCLRSAGIPETFV